MDTNLHSKLFEILQNGNTMFCNFCLLNNQELHYIYADKDSVSLSEQISETFGVEIAEDPLSDYICTECKQTIQKAYNFTKKITNTRKTLTSCLKTLDSKLTTFATNLNDEKHSFPNVIINLNDNMLDDCDLNLFKEEKLLKRESIDLHEKTEIIDLNYLTALKAICKYCFKIFDKNTLKNHLREEHFNETVNINCSECIKKPCSHSKYFEHIKTLRKTGDFKLTCLDCERIFKYKHQLISHINYSHLNITPFLCELCGESFSSMENQQYHTIKYHSLKLECQFCDSNFKNKFNLDNHELSCSKIEREFRCDLCPVSFDTSDRLIVHRNNRHIKHKCGSNACCANEEKDLVKEDVTKKLNNKVSKKIRKLIKKKKRKYKTRTCYLCTDQFDSLKDLLCHLQEKHRPDEVYKCNLCQKVYAVRNNFLSHIKSSSHLRKSDPNYKPNFKCDDCETSYSTMILLERHRNARHLKVLPYTCEKCGKNFAAKSNLKLHLTRHFKQRNYQCNYCSALFTEPTGLKSHILRQHAPEKMKFSCEICGKKFISISECKTHHLRQHSDKSFNCPLCEGKYHTMQNLRGHIKKVHLKKLSLTEYMKDNGFSKDLYEVFRDRRTACVIET